MELMKKGGWKIIISLVVISVLGFLVYKNQIVQKVNIVEREKFVIGTEASFKPFEYRQGSEVVGFDIDLARMIADDMNKDLVVEEMSFDGLIPALKAGKVDAILAGLTITPDRAKSVDFSHGYYTASQKIIVHKNSSIKSSKDLAGKKVAVQLGTTGDTLMTSNKSVHTIQFPLVPSVLQELNSGRVDAAVIDADPATLYLKNFPNLRIINEDLSQEQYAVAVNKNKPELLKIINKTISDIQKDGRYEKLIEKHFSDNTTETKPMSYWQKLHFIFIESNRYMYLIKGVAMTLVLAFFAVLIGVAFGLIIALCRTSHVLILEKIGYWYVTIIRGTPVLVQLLIMYYVVFGSYQFAPKTLVAILAFGLNSAAYVAEIFRSAIENIDIGQYEAASSLGLKYSTTMRYVILPQAFRNSLPSLANEFVSLLKETSVVGWIGANDLMRGADNIRFQTATAFESLIVVAIIYLILTGIFSKFVTKLEMRLKQND